MSREWYLMILACYTGYSVISIREGFNSLTEEPPENLFQLLVFYRYIHSSVSI